MYLQEEAGQGRGPNAPKSLKDNSDEVPLWSPKMLGE